MSYSAGGSPQTGSDSVKGAKRRRAALACTSCRRRKIRCDAAQPACGHCVKTSLQCVYDDSKRRRTHRDPAEPYAGSTPAADASLDRRLRHLESMVTALLENQGVSLKPDADADRASDSSLDTDSESGSESDGSFDGKSDDDSKTDKSDLYNLADRGVPSTAKKRDSAELVAPSDAIYSHGVTTAVMTPTCMRWLCTRVGNPELGKEAEGLLSWLWRQKAMCEWPARTPAHVDLDLGFVHYCAEQYRKCAALPLKLLISNEDLDAAIIACNGDLKMDKLNEDSPYALVFATVVMVVTNNVRARTKMGRYTTAQTVEQNRLAFLLGTRVVSNLFMSHTTILLLRLLVAFIYMMSHRAMLSQLRSLGSLALCMACTLGLQREETSRHLPPAALRRRKFLWGATQSIDIMLSLFLFQQPLITPHPAMTMSRADWEGEETFYPVQQRWYLNGLYMKAYQRLFSIQARKYSASRLLRHILKYDAKLKQWKDDLPAHMRDPLVAADSIVKVYSSPVDENGRDLEPFEILDRVDVPLSTLFTFLCYYHILILLHSIPALTPSALDAYARKSGGRVPQRLQDSLEIMSDSARMLLAILSHKGGVLSDAVTMYLATNAFCVLFLKHIRQPRNPTNSADVKLFYNFISHFRKRTAEPTSTMSTDISRSVISAWLILANAVSELNRKYQSSLPSSEINDIRQAEEEALDGFESPFPSAMLRQHKHMQLEAARAVEPQVNQSVQRMPASLRVPRMVNFPAGDPQQALPGRPAMMPEPGAQMRPPQPPSSAGVPAPGGPAFTAPAQQPLGHPPLAQPPLTQPQLVQLPLPTPQHTPPQGPYAYSLAPIQGGGGGGGGGSSSGSSGGSGGSGSGGSGGGPAGVSPIQQGVSLTPLQDMAKVDANAVDQNQRPNDSMDQSGTTGWAPMGMFPELGTAYSSPSDEGSLWEAFSGVRNMQSNVYEQAMQSGQDASANYAADDCVIQ